MPPTSVYLVLPSRIALIAASLPLSGGSTYGSPAPRPMTLRPAAFSARALSVTAIVADGFTRSSAADRKGIIISLGTYRVARHQFASVVNVTRSRTFLVGSAHPKAHGAASQEGSRNLNKLFKKRVF